MPRKTKETEKKEATKKVTSSKKKSNIKKDVKVKESKAKVAKKAAPKTSAVKEKKVTKTKSTPAKRASTAKEKASTKKTATAKKVASKASAVKEKKVTKTKSTPAKKASTAKKKTTTKKAATTKKVTSKASAVKEKKVTKTKSTPAKKASTAKKKTTTKKATTTKKVSIKKASIKPKTYSPEYYDLPFKYDKTVVTILAQTPTNLFIYWEISDDDRNKLKEQYGEYFFEITKPVLIIHNLTKEYSFEIDINDFANSWYVNVADSDCEYKIELGRRPTDINYNYMPQYDVEKQGPIEPVTIPYIYISSSNELISPNDRVLFNWSDKIYFRNVKTGKSIVRFLKDLSFIDRYGKVVSLYELYKKEYGDDFLRNPSSGGNSSSLNFSSRFK